MHWNEMPLRTRVLWLNVGTLLLACGVFFMLNQALERVRVNGSLYQEIGRGQHLVADIMPPPQFIIEARLVTYELMEAAQQADTQTFDNARARWQSIRAEYGARHAYWARELPPGALRSTLLGRAHSAANAFFDVTEQSYLPKLRKGDIAGARRVLFHQLQPLFQAHRLEIEHAVLIASRENKAREERAAAIVRQLRWAVLGGGLLAISLIWWTMRRWWIAPVVRGVARVRNELDTIGRGELAARPASNATQNPHDEFGQILRAVELMRERLRDLVASLQQQPTTLLSPPEIASRWRSATKPPQIKTTQPS